jgi:hypothetical protein
LSYCWSWRNISCKRIYASEVLRWGIPYCYVSNYLLPSKVINFDTPAQCLLKETPDYNGLCTFGCACWPNLRPYNNRKLSFRSIRCVFLGHSQYHKGFKCLEPKMGESIF